MSIPVLTQVYEEVRRLAIAGSSVAPGDFRLKKLLPQLEQAGAKVPVFAKVAEATKGLLESNEKTAPTALLEVTSLINAILYTQGETGLTGKLQPIATVNLGISKTQASARVLKPLLEALTTGGSGRMEIVRDAYEQGAFRDLRLITPALEAIDDSYSEMSEFVATKILPIYGPAILPELKAKFDPKGKQGHARRLLLMHQLDAAGTRDLIKQSLDEGSKEVRIAAIECLGDAPEDLTFLREQVKSKAKDVRQAALKALGTSSLDAAVNMLCEAVNGTDFDLAVAPIRGNRSPGLTEFLLTATTEQFDILFAGKERDKKKLGTMNDHARMLLECLRGRDDKKSEKFLLDLFGKIEQIARIAGEPSGTDILERLVSVMASGTAKMQSALVDSQEKLPAVSLQEAFIAAVRCRKPAEVFKMFGPYLDVEAKKKGRDLERRNAIRNTILQGRRYWHYAAFEDRDNSEPDIAASLDGQWLDLAVKKDDIELAEILAVEGHAKANAMLAANFDETLGKANQEGETIRLLATMVRVKHSQATDATIRYIQRQAKAKYYYGSYWLNHLIPRLPKEEALPKLEALLPTLPEKMIDQLLDVVTQLKNSV
jgi:hypothetical protein